jgi:hypothetical protein
LCKKRRKRTTYKEEQTKTKRKKLQLGAFRKHERRVLVPFQYKKGLDGSLVTIPLGGLVVDILQRFSWHDETYESNHFLEQRKRRMTTSSPSSTSNNTTKVKRPREDGFCVFCISFV